MAKTVEVDRKKARAKRDRAQNATVRPDAKASLGDQTIGIARLHLDTKNPRHEPFRSDAQVIAQLCSEEQVLELAKDIAEKRSLSPLDVLGVIPYDGHPGHFIAVEGNRRTCALLLLADPSRAPTGELRDQFKRLAQAAAVPKQLKVHVFVDRKAAKPWIDLRHLGSQGGRGTREWNADQKTRAAGNNPKTSSTANALALEVLDRLTKAGLLSVGEREKVALTTISRYLGTPGVRAILGLGGSKKLEFTYEPHEVDRAMRRLVLDSIQPNTKGEIEVHSRAGSEERIAYANKLKAEGIAPTRALPKPVAPPPAAPAGTSGKQARSAISPDKLRKLFDSSFTVKSKDPVLLRLRGEALKLDIEDFPFAANYLLRAFIEQTMVLYLKAKKRWQNNMSDEQLTQACHTALRDSGVKGKALSVVGKAAGSAANPFSLHSLGHAVHGGSIPTRQGLRAVSDTWRPALELMLKEI
jgi:hypothetical protein